METALNFNLSTYSFLCTDIRLISTSKVKIKDLIGDSNKVTIIVPRDLAKYGRI